MTDTRLTTDAGATTGARATTGAHDGKPRRSGSVWARLDFLIGRRRGRLGALAATSVASGLTEAMTFAIIAQVAAALVTGRKQVAVHAAGIHVHAAVLDLIGVAGLLGLLRLALQFPLAILPAKIASDVQAELRRKAFHAFTRASWGEQARQREGHLQDTMTSQINQAISGAIQATQLLTTSLTFLVLLAAAFALNPLAAGAVLLTSIAIFGLLRPLRQLGVRNARRLSRSQIRYAGSVAEAIRLAQETHVFGVQAAQRERVDGYIDASRRLFLRVQLLARLIANLYMSIIFLLMVGGLLAVYYAGKGHAGLLAGVVLLLVRAGMNGQGVTSTYQTLSQSLPFIERVQDSADRFLRSAPPEGHVALERVGSLAFEDVSFSYRAGRPVLSDISFEVPGGETVGIIGPSGAGKSTLVQILLQLREPSEGRYLIDGLPAEEYRRADWHRLVSFVPQEPRLLHASVADNIRYFREIDDAAVERAGRLARIHDDVMSWPDGYASIVGPRADAVSGGQQQRICLARALASDPAVLVLDEPTSALDPHSETLIQESLTALKHELTLFIIAHRMSTLEICDRVMVIVDGRLVAFDKRALLQTENSYYRSASLIAAGSGRLS
jgi:ABC-type multidrug transport system fused ATPase/permease subunit